MNIPYLECFFERCLLWGPFWQKKLCWAFFWRKIIFLSPLLSQTAFMSTFFQHFFENFFPWPLFGWLFWALSWICLCTRESFFLGNAFLSKNTILSTSLSDKTFLSVFLSTILRAFSVERFLSALLSTFLSVFFVEHFFECFFEHYKHNSRYFGTLLIKKELLYWTHFTLRKSIETFLSS